MERRLQYSGILVTLGLLVEVLCLLWTRPIAFVVFLRADGLFLGLGIPVYLFALVSSAHSER